MRLATRMDGVRSGYSAKTADPSTALLWSSGRDDKGRVGYFSGAWRLGWTELGVATPRRLQSRVEMWRGGVGAAYLFPALSSAGASLASPCSVSTSRSSNRTGAFNASGSRRKHHVFAHGRLRVRCPSRRKPNCRCSVSSENVRVPCRAD